MVNSLPVCNRCRQVTAATGDSWCLTCSAWEALGRELSGHWDHQGCRSVAADLITNCVRQVRALRSLGAGISRAPGGPAPDPPSSAGGHRAESPRRAKREREEPVDRRATLPRRRSGHRSTKAEPSDADLDEEEESEEEDEEGPVSEVKPLYSGRGGRPPEPEGPPPSHREHRETRDAGHGRSGQSKRSDRKHRSEGDRGRSRRRDRGRTRKNKRCGGRKHQRL